MTPLLIFTLFCVIVFLLFLWRVFTCQSREYWRREAAGDFGLILCLIAIAYACFGLGYAHGLELRFGVVESVHPKKSD